MKVLLAVPSLERKFGGPVDVSLGLQAGLESLHVEVGVMGAGSNPTDAATALPVVARFHGTPISLSLRRIAAAVRRADVVHIIGYRDPVGTASALAARAAGVPYLLEPVGMHRRRIRSVRLKALYDATLGRAVVGGARLLVATSRAEAQELEEDGIAPSRVAVRANGIDFSSLHPLPPRGGLRHRLGLDSTTPLVLSLGRIARKKGLSLLTEAMMPLPDAHLAIVGPDDRDGTVAAVREAAARLSMTEHVHVLTAGLWGADKLEALVDADVFCLFSQTENFGIAPGEAAACGTPTIVSDQCGVAEWLGDGVAVVPYADVHCLSATIESLLRSPAERRALGERGRIAARALSWEAIAKQQVALYERLLHLT